MDYPSLLVSVRRALRRIPLDEAFIHHDRAHVRGLCEGDERIVINPETLIVETLLHEALHALHEKWSEKRVEKEAAKLLATLTDREVRGLYRTYQRRRQHLDETVDLEES